MQTNRHRIPAAMARRIKSPATRNSYLCKTPRNEEGAAAGRVDAPNLVTHLIPQAAKSNKIFLPPMGEFPGRTGGTGGFQPTPRSSQR